MLTYRVRGYTGVGSPVLRGGSGADLADLGSKPQKLSISLRLCGILFSFIWRLVYIDISSFD